MGRHPRHASLQRRAQEHNESSRPSRRTAPCRSHGSACRPAPGIRRSRRSRAPGSRRPTPRTRSPYRTHGRNGRIPRHSRPPAHRRPVGARPHRQGKLPGALEHALTGPRPLSRRPHGPPGPGSGRRHGPVPAAGVGEKNSPPASNALSRAAYGPCGPHPPGSSPGKRQEGRCGPPGQEAPPPGRNRRQPPHALLPASRFVAISGAPGDHATNPGGVDPRRPGAYLFLAGRRRREAHG